MNRPVYELKTTTEKFAEVSLEIHTIADLDRAIDALCEGVDDQSAEAIVAEDLCPYFGVIWPAARAAANHVAKMGRWLSGKSVLEVGCGLALPSLVAAKLGANVTCTDFHPEVEVFLKRNCEANGISTDHLKYIKSDWRKPNPLLSTYDFVIGSDILYEKAHPIAVAEELVSRCGPRGHIILTDPGRTYLQTCTDEILKKGFRVDTLITTVSDPHRDRAGDAKTKDVFVLVFQKRI